MTPYYDEGGITIYHGDCRDLVAAWDVAGAVMVTDPPYGIRYVTSKRSRTDPLNGNIEGDDDPTLRDEVLAVWGDRPALVFGTWKVARPSNTKQLIVWDKGPTPGMGDLTCPWGPAHEDVYVLGSGFVGRRKPNILRYPTMQASDSNRPAHPTPKPLGLMRDLVSYCPPLALVVDPFMGSGTTLRAAKDLGRAAIGIEVEERYCELAARRLGQGVLDFDAPADIEDVVGL